MNSTHMLAIHTDGNRCALAETSHDCPHTHRYLDAAEYQHRTQSKEGPVARHTDGERCPAAATSRNCPRHHRYTWEELPAGA